MEKKVKIFLLIICFLLAALITTISSSYLAKYTQIPILPDFFLDMINGQFGWAMKAIEIILVLCIASFIIILYQEYKKGENILNWLFVIAFFYIVRGLLLPLTVTGPLPSTSFFKNVVFDYGQFPSGHIAIPFLFFLFTYKKNKIWPVYLIITIAVAILLILGKQHYSIDIVASLFIAYAIKCFSERDILRKKSMKNSKNV